MAEARAEIAALGARMAASHPTTHATLQAEVLPYAQSITGVRGIAQTQVAFSRGEDIFLTHTDGAVTTREVMPVRFTQLELALLCKEHVLVVGPPGTAKSAIASAVLSRIRAIDSVMGLIAKRAVSPAIGISTMKLPSDTVRRPCHHVMPAAITNPMLKRL